MTYRLAGLPGVEIHPTFTTEREWLEHLRILAELPYPSLALMPSILPVMRCRIPSTIGGFGWTDQDFHPVAFMTESINEEAYRWWINNLETAFRFLPVRRQWETRGDVVRDFCASPGFEDSDFCRRVLLSQGLRWMALAPVLIGGGTAYGFLSLYRSATAGTFNDAEQACLVRGAEALADLDRSDNPLLSRPPAALQEAKATGLMLRSDGSFGASGSDGKWILYLLGGANMYSLEWAQPNWQALPNEVRETARDLFNAAVGEASRRIRLMRPWGRFDFTLEKMPDSLIPGQTLVMVAIRYYEPVDITLARRLVGWPLSPREKRMLIAASRSANLAEMATALGIRVNTLKSYNKEMVDRLGVISRQALIDLLLGDEAAEHDLLQRT